MELNTLKDLYIHELKDLYSAEKQIIAALPKMVKAASNEQLAAMIRQRAVPSAKAWKAWSRKERR
jgi:ferritin-like metal-binding protein YciE